MDYNSAVSQDTLRYLKDNYGKEFDHWYTALSSEAARLCRTWGVEITGSESRSRFGAILYGKSERYGDVVLKIIPSFCERLETEIYCYDALPYREMCPFYERDTKFGALLLKRVCEKNDASEETKIKVFKSLKMQRKPYNGENTPLPVYGKVVKNVLNIAGNCVEKSGSKELKIFFEPIERTLRELGGLCGGKQYFVHGDAHTDNMLIGEEACVLIDPLGYIAPFEIEYARYLGSAVKFTNMTDEAFMRLVKQLVPEEESIARVLTAFAIDTTLRGCNTFIEGNTPEEIVFGGQWACRAWEYADRNRAEA